MDETREISRCRNENKVLLDIFYAKLAALLANIPYGLPRVNEGIDNVRLNDL